MNRRDTEKKRKKVKQKSITNPLGEHLDAYWTIQQYGDFGSDWLTFIRENK
jgi:hypothetical protein